MSLAYAGKTMEYADPSARKPAFLLGTIDHEELVVLIKGSNAPFCFGVRHCDFVQ